MANWKNLKENLGREGDSLRIYIDGNNNFLFGSNASKAKHAGEWIEIDTSLAFAFSQLDSELAYMNIPLTTYDNWESYENNSSSSEIIQDLAQQKVSTGTTSGSVARQNTNRDLTLGSSGKWLLFKTYLGGISGNTLGFIGVTDIKYDETYDFRSQTNSHAGIWYEDGNYYISCANGSTQSENGISISGDQYILIYRHDGQIDFHGDQSGKLGTLSSNLPASNGYLTLFVNNKSTTTDIALYAYNWQLVR